MKIIADLHVHSKYSRATAKNLDFENLYVAAQIKGVQIVGTGDFSHPAWFNEIESKLEPAEPGLFRLTSKVSTVMDRSVPALCRDIVRFILVTEISNIYKREGKTRKNHNLVFVPDLDAARRLNRRLEKIGNIKSDGRPILGLDARDLLEIVLETAVDAFLIPAHIWTPWFSVLGSRSGFDSIRECFGDLSDFIFAAETGLSSDPAMNWRVSFLDGITLVSNSDAHSPANIGREANLFDTDLSYFEMRDALKNRDSENFQGTIEFFPEEGKYHLDGHRHCGVRLEPKQSKDHQGLCPQCGKPLTIGVLHRVEDLADRRAGEQPQKARPYHSFIPLSDILSEILQTGSKSQKVIQAYRSAIETLGPELRILQQADFEDIKRCRIPLLDEALKRIREKRVEIRPGFDGEYGQIKIFDTQERSQIQGQLFFFSREYISGGTVPVGENSVTDAKSIPTVPSADDSIAAVRIQPSAAITLSTEQRRIVEYDGRRLLIVAGPGTGKTQTLTWRIATQILQSNVPADQVLAITFTNKAANEMRSRLKTMIGEKCRLPLIATFHGLCLRLLIESGPDKAFGIIDDEEQVALLKQAASLSAEKGAAVSANISELKAQIVSAKQNLKQPIDLEEQNSDCPDKAYLISVYQAYQKLLEIQGLMDFEDLIFNVVRRLEAEPQFCRACQERFRYVYVDEYQDLNHGQFRMIKFLVPTGSDQNALCVIGDPDQSIYGFRGSDPLYFRKFLDDYPDSAVLRLTRNYRSTNTILSASFQVINQDEEVRIRTYSSIEGVDTISIMEARNDHVEGASIARTIEGMIGGTGYHSIDTGRVSQAYSPQGWGYSDFAVLARTGDQLRHIAEAFEAAGIPFQPTSRPQTFKERGVAGILSLIKIIYQCGSYQDFETSAALLAPHLNKRIRTSFTDWCQKKRLRLKEGLVAAARFPIPGLSRNQQFELTAFIGHLSALQAEIASLKEGERLTHLRNHPSLSTWMADEKTREALNRIVEMVGDSRDDKQLAINQIALCSDTDLYHPRAEKVALMTMHAAKGLEFAVVFIAGCEDGLIPYRRSAEFGTNLEEERRLFYVAMTRAKERLFLTWARQRKVFGKTVTQEKSPFVHHIETRFLQDESTHGSFRRKKADQLKLF
jgi:DNA helicase II / ATP-dependent DNA helicase PcrA